MANNALNTSGGFLQSGLGGQVVGGGLDLVGSILGWWGNKGAMKDARGGIDDLKGQIGKPLFNVDNLVHSNLQDLWDSPMRDMWNKFASNQNIDQPRANDEFIRMLSGLSSGIRSDLVPKEAMARGQRDANVGTSVAQLLNQLAL